MSTVNLPEIHEEQLVQFIKDRTDYTETQIQDILALEVDYLEKQGIIVPADEHEAFGTIQQLTREFHILFGHPVADKPTIMSIERATNRSKWTGQELVEFLAASAKSPEEFAKAFYTFQKGLEEQYMKSLKTTDFNLTEVERAAAQNDAAGDAAYFIGGTFNELGTDMDRVVSTIHEANRSKLFTDENGKKYVKEGPDGKVMKSPDFQPPEENLIKYIESIM